MFIEKLWIRKIEDIALKLTWQNNNTRQKIQLTRCNARQTNKTFCERFNYLASLLIPTTLLFGKYPTWAYEKKRNINFFNTIVTLHDRLIFWYYRTLPHSHVWHVKIIHTEECLVEICKFYSNHFFCYPTVHPFFWS